MITAKTSGGLIAADARIAPLAETLTTAEFPCLSPGEETTAEPRLTVVHAAPLPEQLGERAGPSRAPEQP